MKLKDYIENVEKVNIDEIEVNPIRLLEEKFFNDKFCSDYRGAAINVCNNKSINWSSTENNAHDVSKRYVKIKCPKCHKEMEISNGSSNSSVSYTTYKCTCKTQVTIAIPLNGFSVKFSQE